MKTLSVSSTCIHLFPSVSSARKKLKTVFVFLSQFIAVEYPTITSVWAKFQGMFDTLTEAIYYLPAFRAYHWQLLEELYHDNVMYAELRISMRHVGPSATSSLVFQNNVYYSGRYMTPVVEPSLWNTQYASCRH